MSNHYISLLTTKETWYKKSILFLYKRNSINSVYQTFNLTNAKIIWIQTSTPNHDLAEISWENHQRIMDHTKTCEYNYVIINDFLKIMFLIEKLVKVIFPGITL